MIYVSWVEYSINIQEMMSEGELLIENFSGSKSLGDLNSFRNAFVKWRNEIIEYTKETCSLDINKKISKIKPIQQGGLIGPSNEQVVRSIIDCIKRINNAIHHHLRELSVCDIWTFPEHEEEIINNYNGVADRMNLLLHKLYQLRDDYFYSLKTIALGNGVFTGQRELREIVERLEYQGVIRIRQKTVGASEMAQITLDGQLIVEESLKAETTDYEVIGANDEVSEKLDQILQEIQKLSKEQFHGHDIIYDEIQELREALPLLNKKSWGQYMKGKLMDLVAGQVINVQTAEWIFKYITEQTLLLK